MPLPTGISVSRLEEIRVLPIVEELVDAWFQYADNPVSETTTGNRLLYLVEHYYYRSMRAK